MSDDAVAIATGYPGEGMEVDWFIYVIDHIA